MEVKGGFIAVFITIFLIGILGAVFADIIGEQSYNLQRTDLMNNESQTMTLGFNVTLKNPDVINVNEVRNASENIVSTGNYTWWTNGKFQINNITGSNNGVYYVNYSYYPTYYIKDSASRTIIGLLVLLFVLGVVITVIALSWKTLQDLK